MMRPRRLPGPNVARPAIVLPTRATVEGGAVASGRFPGVVVYIAPTAKNRRELERFCA